VYDIGPDRGVVLDRSGLMQNSRFFVLPGVVTPCMHHFGFG
jgi:hypothetical protein